MLFGSRQGFRSYAVTAQVRRKRRRRRRRKKEEEKEEEILSVKTRPVNVPVKETSQSTKNP